MNRVNSRSGSALLRRQPGKHCHDYYYYQERSQEFDLGGYKC